MLGVWRRLQGRRYRRRKEDGERRKSNSKRGKEWKRQKVMLNQFYLLLLVSDPIETTIFGFLIPRAKTFGWFSCYTSSYFVVYFCSVAIKAQNSLVAICSLWKPRVVSFRWWMRMNKSGSDCVSSISVIYFLFQISSQMDFLCCPGDHSSPWQPCTPPAVIAWVYYYKEKCCSMYSTL